MIGIVVVLGLATAASSMGVGVYVMLTQGQWIGQLIRSVALFSATIGNWMDAAVATVATVTNTPQARTVGIVYFGVALIVIAGWVQLLRRSARLSDAIPTPGLE